MAASEIVKRIVIAASGVAIEKTTKAVLDLAGATGQAQAANDNYQKQLDRASGNSSNYWTETAAQVGLLYAAFQALKTVLSWIVDAVAAVFRAVGAVLMFIPNKIGEAWDLGKKQIDDYNKLNDEAGNNSTDFYQKLIIGANNAKVKVDLLVDSLKTMNEQLRPKLDGTTGTNRLDELVKWGNFKGNTGVDELKRSTTDQERYAAAESFYRQALDANEKLAAQEAMRAIAGDKLANALDKDSEVLRNVKRQMDAIKASEIINKDDIDRAAGLRAEMEKAQKIIAGDLKPDTKTLTTLIGVEMYAAWVKVVSLYASAVQWMRDLFTETKKVSELKPDSAWQTFKEGNAKESYSLLASQFGQKETPEGRSQYLTQTLGYDPDDPRSVALFQAKQRLGSSMQNPANIARSNTDLEALYEKTNKDQSKGKPEREVKDAYDRAEESLLKYIQTTEAMAKTVDLGAAAQERGKAMAQLVAAGLKDGLTPSAAKAKAEMSGLADKAAAAADGLAKARVQSSIEWDRKTAFLSNDDIAIAQQLKSIYGQDIPAALNSSYAASIRLNSAMHEVGGIINTAFDSMAPAIRESINGTNSLADGFKKLGLTAVNALQDMIIKLTVIKPLMNAIGGGFDLSSIFGSSSASVPSSVMVGNYAMPKFAGGTSYAPGGMALVGEEGPELVNLPAGASVTPNRKTMATLQGGGTTVQANFAPTYNVTGSGPEIEKLRQQMAEDRANFEARTVAAVRNAKQGRRL